jgi:hypothetical protein
MFEARQSGKFNYQPGFDGCQVLAFIDGDAVIID